MNGRIYTVNFTDIAVTAAKTLIELIPAANKPIEIVGIEIGQTTEFGDAQDETLKLTITRGAATTGTGTAATPAPLSPADTAAGVTAKVNMTAESTGGTEVVLWNSAWNVRAGYINWFPEGIRPASINGSLLLLKQSLPADSVTLSGTLYVRELA